MRKLRLLAFAAGLAAVAAVAAAGDGSSPARASHGNLNVHVHDDYYHPVGAFLVNNATDHGLAKAACEAAQPDAQCDAVIHVGDTITWVAPPPLAANQHTVTECSDGTFQNCGANVSAANPIGDSGVRSQPQWPYGPVQFNQGGVYFYRCEVHPQVMRGRVQVIQENQPPQGVGGVAGLLEGGEASAIASGQQGGGEALYYGLALAAAGSLALAGAGLWLARRRAAAHID